MREVLAFDILPFKWDNPPSNQRKIFASKQALTQLKFLEINVGEFLKKLSEIMKKKDFHYAYIGKCQAGYSVAFHQFSGTLIKYLKENPVDEKEAVSAEGEAKTK